MGQLNWFSVTISTWIKFSCVGYLTFWLVRKKQTIKSFKTPSNGVHGCICFLKTWWLWMIHGFIILILNKKSSLYIGKPPFLFHHRRQRWHYQIERSCFSCLGLWRYNYDWKPGKWTSHPKRLQFRFANKTAVRTVKQKAWKTQ